MITIGRGKSAGCSGVTRRDFLWVGGLGLGSLGFTQAELAAATNSAYHADRSVILLLLVGGPSQLETWDPKPGAPAEVRGPFRSIATRCPGVRICEHLPRLAERMDRLALIRSVHHEAAPIHETGHQLLQTGQLCHDGEEPPYFGSVVAMLNGLRNGQPVSAILPGPIASTGVQIGHGQSSGWLGKVYDPFTLNADPGAPDFDPRSALDRAMAFLDEAGSGDSSRSIALTRTIGPLLTGAARNPFDLGEESGRTREAYGRSTFGQCCLLARRLVESGVRVVTVNMYATVFNQVTWDCHGSAPFSTLDDYARELLPTFDRAFSALIDDLDHRGRLDSTLVVAAGEFGRTPRLNASGGRDHWPGVWSVALAGGGVRSGQVIGASDGDAGAPRDRPVTPQDLLATIYHSLGIDASQNLSRTDGQFVPIIDDGRPIRELLG
jgi:Protein of unknown function (DUF1501)